MSAIALVVISSTMTLGCAQRDMTLGRAQRDAALRLELDRSHQRAERLQRDVKRLQIDIHEAEQALIALESGLMGIHTRAEAVSTLADARIMVERAAAVAPWRKEAVQEAREKLAEADRHVEAEHFGSAIFFSSRARRIASTLTQEVEAFKQSDKVRYVSGQKANLRSEPSARSDVLEVLSRQTPVVAGQNGGRWIRVRTPSGRVGWIHTSLLSEQD